MNWCKLHFVFWLELAEFCGEDGGVFGLGEKSGGHGSADGDVARLRQGTERGLRRRRCLLRLRWLAERQTHQGKNSGECGDSNSAERMRCGSYRHLPNSSLHSKASCPPSREAFQKNSDRQLLLTVGRRLRDT